MFKKGLSGVLAVLGNQQADWTIRIRALESLHGIMEEDEDGEILEELNRSFVQINHQVRGVLVSCWTYAPRSVTKPAYFSVQLCRSME